MTIIAAVNIDRQIWVGSDTVSTYMDSLYPCQPKWVIAPDGKSAVGHAGDKLVEQIARREVQSLSWGETPEMFSVSLKNVMDKSGYLRAVFDDKEATGDYRNSWIYAWKSGMAHIACDFSTVPVKKIAAKGSGERYALGASFAAAGTAPKVLTTMLRAAISFDLYCGGKPWIWRIK